MTRGRLLRIAGVVAVLVALAVVAAAVFVLTADVRPFAERRISAALDRPVTVGSAAIRWGNPIGIDLGDVRVANAPWGREPAMAQVARIGAAVDPWALLGGRLVLTRLTIDQPTLLLERDDGGRGNWKPSAAPSGDRRPARDRPPARTRVPLVLDLALRSGTLVMHTSGGQRLEIELATLSIRTAGDDQPVSLQGEGAYNGAAISLKVTMDPFEVLRDPVRPYGIDGAASSDGNRIALAGHLARPLDFDGIDGRLDVAAEDLGGLAKLFGSELAGGVSLKAGGHLLRDGDRWQLEALAGTLAGAAIDGSLLLAEGAGKEPNAVRLSLAAADIDLDRLARRPGASPDWRTWTLPAPTAQDDRLDAVLKAQRATLAGLPVQDLSLQIATAPGRVTLAPISLSTLGGRIQASVTALAEGPRRRMALTLGATDLVAGRFLSLLRGRGRPLTGRLDLAIDLAGAGARLGDAAASAAGHAVLTMGEGQVSRSLFRAASTDILALFDDDRGRLPLACLLAVADIREGIATVAPLRLRTPEGTLFAGGRIDIARNAIDGVVRSEQTGFFALDLPLQVSGRLDSPSVTPVPVSSSDAWKARGAAALTRLPPALRGRATENACAR